MVRRVVAWDSVTDRLVRTDKDPADIMASAIPDVVSAGTEAVAEGATSASITYAGAFPNTSYVLVANLVNLVDASPQFQPLTITEATTTGFTVKWNASTDSANYQIDYIAVSPCTTFRANIEDLSSGQSSKTSNLLAANTLAVCPQLVNETDASPLYMPDVITSKTGTQFVTSWPSSVDSDNYDLHWAALSGGSCSNTKSSVTALSSGVSSKAVSFDFPEIGSSSYACICRLHNTTDSSVLYMPVTVTGKTLSGFTAKWNTPTDSANYELSWMVFISS